MTDEERTELPHGVTIIILDMEGKYRDHPEVTARYPDGREERIDVFETVKNNALSIGHPLVLHAIRRWEAIVRYHHAFSRKPRGSENHPSENPRRVERSRYYNTAKRHLENIGRALLEGAKERAVPLSGAVAMDLESGSNRPHYGHLREIWRLMGEREFKYQPLGDGLERPRRDNQKINYLRRKLCGRWPAAAVEEMIAFLQSEKGESFLSKRGRVEKFRNAFDSWRTGYARNAVKVYRSKAKREQPENSDIRFLAPDRADRLLLSEIGDWRRFPTVSPRAKRTPKR